MTSRQILGIIGLMLLVPGTMIMPVLTLGVALEPGVSFIPELNPGECGCDLPLGVIVAVCGLVLCIRVYRR